MFFLIAFRANEGLKGLRPRDPEMPDFCYVSFYFCGDQSILSNLSRNQAPKMKPGFDLISFALMIFIYFMSHVIGAYSLNRAYRASRIRSYYLPVTLFPSP